MKKRERETNAGREIKSRRGTGSQQHLIPREWSMTGVIVTHKRSTQKKNKVVRGSWGVQRWTLAVGENSRWIRWDNCCWQLEDFHFHLRQFITNFVFFQHFPHKQKGPLTLLSKLSPFFFWQPTTTNPQTSARSNGVQISLSPPARARARQGFNNFDSGICSRQKIVNDSPSLFGIRALFFCCFFFSIDPPWQLLLFLLLDPINLYVERVSDQRHKSSRLRVDTAHITMCCCCCCANHGNRLANSNIIIVYMGRRKRRRRRGGCHGRRDIWQLPKRG